MSKIKYPNIYWGSVACAMLLSACGGGGDGASASAGPSTIVVTGQAATVTTAKGQMTGVVSADTVAFKGIPFAQPPMGNLRWRPPVADDAPWTGARDNTKFGKVCLQPGLTVAQQATAGEDCLTLNVYVPKAVPADKTGSRRAVMVWIHGGANAVGASSFQDPAPLVAQEDVVVVSVNYRLGALGFLAHPAIDGEGHAFGNYGVMDQQLALKWVKDNVAAFGGDPANVTLFGVSAGGLNILSHLVSPLSAGLFHKAIVESGAYQLDTPPLAASEASGNQLGVRLGCTDQSAACLRGKSAAEVLAQQGTVNSASSVFNQSTVDGKVLVEPQWASLVAGRFNRVPVINGANAVEGRVFSAPVLSQAAYEATIGGYASLKGKTIAEGLATYSIAEYKTPAEAASAALGDFAFACSSRAVNKLLAAQVPTFGYEFADPNASAQGATHGAEVEYLIANVGSTGFGWNAAGDSLALSKTMRRYWAQFARGGSPNGGASAAPTWAAYQPASDNVQLLVAPDPRQDTAMAARHKCAFWN